MAITGLAHKPDKVREYFGKDGPDENVLASNEDYNDDDGRRYTDADRLRMQNRM